MRNTRSTILIGNGLGMAIDSDHFSLSTALKNAWNTLGDGALSHNDKLRVANCLSSEDISEAPTTEEDLELLQRVITACDFLNSIGKDDIHWLSEEGQKFPRAVRRYFGLTASHFLDYYEGLPGKFCDSLCRFIQSTRSHVATLNYDNLLYNPFVSNGICSGYDGWLVDGFHESGFSPENLERRFGRNFGWYMHLHGSPLFLEDKHGCIKKISTAVLPCTHSQRKHLILTHHSYKLPILQSSPVLECYWDKFRLAMMESRQLIVIGYSGEDEHINRRIKARLRKQDLKVHVVEWSGTGNNVKRKSYWRKLLGKINTLTRLDNILDFDFQRLDQNTTSRTMPSANGRSRRNRC